MLFFCICDLHEKSCGCRLVFVLQKKTFTLFFLEGCFSEILQTMHDGNFCCTLLGGELNKEFVILSVIVLFIAAY